MADARTAQALLSSFMSSNQRYRYESRQFRIELLYDFPNY
jgi:hypothetical protein